MEKLRRESAPLCARREFQKNCRRIFSKLQVEMEFFAGGQSRAAALAPTREPLRKLAVQLAASRLSGARQR